MIMSNKKTNESADALWTKAYQGVNTFGIWFIAFVLSLAVKEYLKSVFPTFLLVIAFTFMFTFGVMAILTMFAAQEQSRIEHKRSSSSNDQVVNRGNDHE